MITRAIVIFPVFGNMAVIDRLRARFDPLADKIRPHITLVFPFKSNVSADELRAEVTRCVSGVKPFCVSLCGTRGHECIYLFLKFREGADRITMLHDLLYAGALAPFRSKDIAFQPHLTIGRFITPAAFEQALSEVAGMRDEFTSIVDRITVERILPDEKSEVEFTVSLE